ncbi:MAG: glycosyltransferase family 2 protein [Endomicrobiaceae bacterium]|nr:glycosyltransferase family 2 protein [Endomicrobiaceae bacterium]
MDISIIIPVYNAEPYLKQCLDSVISQTFKNIEIIIINDYSTDNSSQIIETYKKTDNRIISIHLKKNAGAGSARNEGLKIATGKYIVFIDSDDWVTPDYIEVLYNNIEKYNCDMISANFYIYDNKTGYIQQAENSKDLYNTNFNSLEKKRYFLLLNNNYIWIRIYNKDFLKKNNIYFKLNKLEDSLFLWEIALSSDNFMFIDETIYYYRANRNNSLTTSNYASAYIEGLREIKKILINKNAYKFYEQPFFLFAMTGIAHSFESSGLPYKQLTDIFYNLKNEFFNNKDVKFYKENNFHLSARLYLLYFCLKYNINYVKIIKICKFFHLGKLLRIIYK